MTKKLTDDEKQERLLERLVVDNANLRRLNRKLLRRGGFEFEKILDEIRDIVLTEKPFAYTPSQVADHKPLQKPPARSDHDEIATLVLSDFHCAENVNEAEVNGSNKYNTMIFANRLWETIQAAKQVFKLHQSLYKIKELWIPFLGDLLAGEIHQELELYNDLSNESATVLTARLIVLAIMELKTLGVKIRFDCVVGNHTRSTFKMPAKRVATTNYDWVIYEIVKSHFENDPQLEFNICTGYIQVVKRYNWKFILMHGIDVKLNQEDNLEDRLRAIFDDPYYRTANSVKGSTFDQIVIGHLHTPQFREKLIVNGSLTGNSELGIAWRLRPVHAQQLMFGISKNHTRTWQYAIDTTHIRSELVVNPFSKYTKEFMSKYAR